MREVLFKALVAPYYRINTGFFLLLFVLLFCLLDGSSTIALHYAIMQGITTSWYFAGVAILVSALYSYKCISFCVRTINSQENTFLFRIQAVKNKKQCYLLSQCHAAVYLPVLAYSVVATAVGCKEHHYFLSVAFIACQAIMCGVGVTIYLKQLNGTWEKRVLLPPITIGDRKRFMSYLLHYSLSNRKGTFIGVKLFSLFLLQAMVAVNADKLSKEGICVLIMFLISAHALLPLYYVQFIEGSLAFLRNMPLSVTRRMSVYILTYAVIFLPELLFLLLNGHDVMPLPLTLSLYGVSVSQLFLYTTVQYVKQLHGQRYWAFVFSSFFANLFLLASFDLWILFAAELVIALGLFGWAYERYEFDAG